MARRSLNSQFDWYVNGNLKISFNTPITGDDEVDYPRIHMKRAPGWDALPDVDESDLIVPIGMVGEYPTPRTSRGKTQMFELRIEALTEPQLVEYRDLLRNAFADRSSVGFLVAIPWEEYGEDQWMTFARVSDFAGDDEQLYSSSSQPSPWKRDPTVTFRQIDGRWYWFNESGTPSTPMEYSFVTGGDVENTGKFHTDPIITIPGVTAGQDVHIGRTVPGADPDVELWFRQPGAGTLQIDFHNPRRVTLDGVDVSRSYDELAPNNWWDPYVPGIPPGVHEIWRGPGAGTSIQVGFFSASL